MTAFLDCGEGASGGALAPPVERRLGELDQGRPGPLVVVVGGLHGNEPSGVEASRAVLAELDATRTQLRGRVLFLAGNRSALALRRRFCERDLNRMWRPELLAELAARPPEGDRAEERELRELSAILQEELAAARGQVVVLDLHSTSAGGVPFAIQADTLANRALVHALPVPVILGLEEGIEGPLISWLADRGVAAVVVEGGQHDDPATRRHHADAIWLVLAAAGAIDRGLPRVREAYRALKEVGRGLPGVLELEYCHGIDAADRFRMRPGFESFQRVAAGDPLADDRRGPVLAPSDGILLMPLYQGQGEDGFFLGREPSRLWLRFSDALRRRGLDALLPALPGVARHPSRADALLVEEDCLRGIVRWLLCTFGYRKRRPAGEGRWLVYKRPERADLAGAREGLP